MTETPDPFAPPPAQPPQPPQPPAHPGYPPQQGYPPPAPSYPQPGYQQQQPPGYQQPPPGYQVPPPGYAQPYGAPAAYGQPAAPSSGLAIAALVLGIVGCLGFWIPVGGIVAGLIALVLGIVAWRKANKGSAGGKTMAVIGTVLGGLAVVGGIIVTVLVIWVFGRVGHCTDQNLSDQEIKNCVNEEFGVNRT